MSVNCNSRTRCVRGLTGQPGYSSCSLSLSPLKVTDGHNQHTVTRASCLTSYCLTGCERRRGRSNRLCKYRTELVLCLLCYCVTTVHGRYWLQGGPHRTGLNQDNLSWSCWLHTATSQHTATSRHTAISLHTAKSRNTATCRHTATSRHDAQM